MLFRSYVGAYAQRLGWLTGFGGSAGTAAVLPDAAAIFTDGRYTIQVREQVSPDDWQYVGVPDTSVAGWLGAHAREGARIGYDPWLHTRAWVEEARAALAGVGAELVAVDANPVDAVWPDRPAPSDAPLRVQPDDVAGRSSAAKRADVADWLAGVGADAVVIPALDSIAWLLNVRGSDVSRTPVALSYTIVHADGTADLFVALGKVAAVNLLKREASVTSMRGKVHDYRGIPMIVTYHPAYLLRSLPEKAKAWEDLCFAVETMQGLQSATAAPT